MPPMPKPVYRKKYSDQPNEFKNKNANSNNISMSNITNLNQMTVTQSSNFI